MINKKNFFLLLIILLIFAIPAVSAEDTGDNSLSEVSALDTSDGIADNVDVEHSTNLDDVNLVGGGGKQYVL